MTWRPIESAPAAGRFLVAAADGWAVTLGWRSLESPHEVIVFGGKWTPTLWHPIPPLPLAGDVAPPDVPSLPPHLAETAARGACWSEGFDVGYRAGLAARPEYP